MGAFRLWHLVVVLLVDVLIFVMPPFKDQSGKPQSFPIQV